MNTAMVDKGAVAAVRAFNRFYTKILGTLNDGLLRTRYSLAECRVIYELGSRGTTSAAALASDLDLDPAYLSRLLKKLREEGLVSSSASEKDGRAQDLRPSAAGWALFETLDAASEAEVGALIAPLGARASELVRAMRGIRDLLEPGARRPGPCVIRSHRVGDIGHIVSRHGVIYAEEFGWDGSFEGFVAEIAGAFLKSHDPRREHCWIAERNGALLGSVFLVDGGEGMAKLRMLYVEAAARGQGVGHALVDQCISFARQAGYRRMTLWTNDILVPARRIYEAAGFQLVSEEAHHSFGQDLVGQYWEKHL